MPIRVKVKTQESATKSILKTSLISKIATIKRCCPKPIFLTMKILFRKIYKILDFKIISDNSTRSVVAVEGQRVELKCYASGYPPPEIYWRRQDNAVLPTNTSIFKGNVLKFSAVT